MRACGILMPIFSLASKYGIGTLGQEAFNFVDFLKKAGQTYWQILPVGTTSFGDSPYQSFSAYAGNPYFVDFDLLVKEGWLDEKSITAYEWGETLTKIDYELLYKNRYRVLKKAYKSFSKKIPADYFEFERQNSYWLEDYALFMAIKNDNSGASVDKWDKGLKFRDEAAIEKAKEKLSDEINFQKMIQYFFNKQWMALKSYANANGISIIGDIPIYVAYDSADVWADPKQFLLDEDLTPTSVAGCPPDAFSESGQLWGNPLYNWEEMKKNDYSWWLKRISFSSKLYDIVRIDHFRGFSAYFSIPFGAKTAVNGKWQKGPGKEFFEAVNRQLGKLNIIAEDLGTIDEDVRKLLEYTGFPGMKVLQFAFDPNSESAYLPHNIPKNSVVYTGTHDNDTAIGFMNDQNPSEVEFMREYLRISEDESFNWALIKSAMTTVADTVILQMQDFLGLDNSARINKPSTMKGNWQWRIAPGCVNDWLAKIIHDNTRLYYRLPKTDLK